MTKKAARRNFKAAPRLLDAMCRASQKGLSASDWLRLAAKPRNVNLRAELAAYAPDINGSPIAAGHAFKALAGQRLAYEGEWFELIERHYPGDNARRYGIRSPLRERILKARAAAKERDDVRQLQLGETPFEATEHAAPPVVPEPVADHGRREALEATRRAGWFEPLGHRPPPAPIAPAAPEPVHVEPTPAPVPVVHDLPGAWRTRGRPSYATRTHEAPDESFKRPHGAAPSAAELGVGAAVARPDPWRMIK